MFLIFANSDKVKSVAIGLYGMINSMRYTGDYAGMFAAVVIVFLPPFSCICSCQRRLSPALPAAV
jgi:N-acetylglucosamine transport system permease protein